MNTTTYNNAVTAVREHAQARRAVLEADYRCAMDEYAAAARKACTDGISSEAEPIGALVAQTLITCRASDGWPTAIYPPETRAVVLAAHKVGLIGYKLGSHSLRSDLDIDNRSIPGWEAALDTWRKRNEFQSSAAEKL